MTEDDTNPELMPEPTQAMTVRGAVQELEKPGPVTAAQAKIDAVASLTASAYSKASELKLSKEETAALQADFPDEAFKPGAGGKANLLYIEHAFLRDRLNQVIGIGQWALIPRNRWAEDYRTANGGQATRVYVEAMLMVRGCFVAEAVGEMSYFKNNDSQNYGDAVEGAKTAALRRCCKEFGIGLQAWKKDWGDGWWQRNPKGKAPPTRQDAPKTHQPAPEAQKPTVPAQKPVGATQEQKERLLVKLDNDDPGILVAREYFEKVGALLPNEGMDDLPLNFVPVTQAQVTALMLAINAFANGEEARLPFPRNPTNFEKPKPAPVGEEDEPWRSYPMPWGKNAGTPLAKLEKSYLFGLWANYEVETEYNGRPKTPQAIAKDQQFRDYLNAAGEHYQFKKD